MKKAAPGTEALLIWFTPATFAAHRRIGPDGLPQNFDEWQRRTQEARQACREIGVRVIQVEIDAEDCAAWCRQRGARIDDDTRLAFAQEVLDRRRNQ